MHRILRIVPIAASLALVSNAHAQENPGYDMVLNTPPPGQVYTTSGAEWQFSVPVLDVDGNDRGAVVRFTPFFNVQGMAHFDTSERFGIFTGVSVRNHGFIYDDPASEYRFKFRTYNAGMPAGLKFGRMHGTMLFAGYLLELPFHYQEKRFLNEKRDDRFGVWLSGRNERWHHGCFLGLQSGDGFTLTVRYQLNNFHAKGFIETVDGIEIQPYAGLDARVITFSIGYGLFNGERWVAQPRQPAPQDVRTARRTVRSPVPFSG